MDAEKFLNEWRRMCQTKDDCNQCGDGSFQDACCKTTANWDGEDAIMLVHTVISWSETHPLKTRLMDFNEKFPDFAKRLENGCPEYLPWIFGYCGKHKHNPCAGCEHIGNLIGCWDIPMEEK
jgi:hypothetical protein